MNKLDLIALFFSAFICGAGLGFIALRHQKKKFTEVLNRAAAQFQQNINKYYQDGAKAMAEAMRKQLEEMKRIQTSKPFIAATGEKMTNNQRMNIAGIHWKENYPQNKIPLLGEKLWEEAPIGAAFPFIDEGVLKVVINFREGLQEIEKYGELIPTICGVNEANHDEEDINIVDKFSLMAIVLSPADSLDPTIKSINEQIKVK